MRPPVLVAHFVKLAVAPRAFEGALRFLPAALAAAQEVRDTPSQEGGEDKDQGNQGERRRANQFEEHEEGGQDLHDYTFPGCTPTLL